MKVAVIGVGGSGSAALRFLSEAGHEAVGFEQFSIGHAMGSSHGASRLIRRTYADDFHTGLMAEAYRLWDELQAERNEELLVRCGGITFGPADEPKMIATKTALDHAGVGYEWLDRETAGIRFPAIDIGKGAFAIFQKESGYLRANRCVAAQVESARERGAVIRENSPVTALEESAGKVWVSTEGHTEAFDRVIVTAGPWMGELLKPLKLPLQVALRQVVYLKVGDRTEMFGPRKHPVWIEHPSDFYGFPVDGIENGIKVASHDAGHAFDPNRPDRPVIGEALELVRNQAMKRFPSISGEVVSTQSCLYTITPDEHFIVDFASDSKRIAVCSGCSGHGFKFTALLGKITAEMVESGNRRKDLDRWKIRRFQGGPGQY